MLFVDPQRYKRPRLSVTQREFLLRIVPLAGFLQQQTLNKALITRKRTRSGVYASLLAAHMIFKSQWGTHPLAQPIHNELPANNLAMLMVYPAWKKLTLQYEGHQYRGYKNWREFAVDYSDSLAWMEGYNDVLAEEKLALQLQFMSHREINPSEYCATIASLIQDYGLQEFDYYALSEEKD